jgi:hypothetical protein
MIKKRFFLASFFHFFDFANFKKMANFAEKTNNQIIKSTAK